MCKVSLSLSVSEVKQTECRSVPFFSSSSFVFDNRKKNVYQKECARERERERKRNLSLSQTSKLGRT